MGRIAELLVHMRGDSSGVTHATAEAEASLGRLGQSAAKVGKALDEQLASSKLGSKLSNTFNNAFGGFENAAKKAFSNVEGEAQGLGSLLTSPQFIVPAAATAAITAFAVEGVKHFGELAREVQKFKNVSGTTAEDASRFVAVAHKYGVSTDDMSRAVGILTKTLGKNPEALRKYGVEIARTKDGNVDVAKTLANVATAFSLTEDPTTRAALASTAFGRSYQTLLPLLKQGADLGPQLADVSKGLILSDKDLAAQRQLSISLREVKEQVTALEVELGKGIVPELASLAAGAAQSAKSLDGILGPIGGLGSAIGTLVKEIPGVGTLSILGDVTNKNSTNFQKFKDVVTDVIPPLGLIPGLHHSAAKATEETTQASAQQIEVLNGLSTKYDLYTAKLDAAAAKQKSAADFRVAESANVAAQANSERIASEQLAAAQTKLYNANVNDISSTSALAAQHRTAEAAITAQMNAVLGLTDAQHGVDRAQLEFIQGGKQVVDAAKAAADAHGKDALANATLTVAIDDQIDAAKRVAAQHVAAANATKDAGKANQITAQTFLALAGTAKGPVADALRGMALRLSLIGQQKPKPTLDANGKPLDDKVAAAKAKAADLARQHPTATLDAKDLASAKAGDAQRKVDALDRVRGTATIDVHDNATAVIQAAIRLGQQFAGSTYTADVNAVRGVPHAAGGPVYPGVLYPVGERGTEWFMPWTAGTIIPHNARWAGSGSSSSTVIINAPAGTSPREVVAAQARYERRNGTRV